MSARRAARIVWSLWALAIALWTTYFLAWGTWGFPSLPHDTSHGSVLSVFLRVGYAFAFLTASTIGALIASRHPTNPIGWLSAIAGLVVTAQLLMSEYAAYTVLASPGAPPRHVASVAWVGQLLSVNPVLVPPILLLFPDGRLPSRRWAPVLWLAIASAAVAAVCLAFLPGPLGNVPEIVNPFGFEPAAGALSAPLGVSRVAMPVSILLAAAALILRFRRAQGEPRQQLKWVTYAASVWTVCLAASFAAPPEWQAAVSLVYVFALSGFIASLGVAMLKYRLYDVDLVINKTLAYGTLAICVTGVYVAVVVAVGIAAASAGAGSLGHLPALLATAAVALAFQPLRSRAQQVANRLVYGPAADPAKVLAEYAERMAHAVSVGEILPQTAGVVGRAVGAARVRVRVFHTGGEEHRAAWPAPELALALWKGDPSGATGPDEEDEKFDRVLPVLHYGEVIGEIAVAMPAGESLTAAQSRLLASLTTQAGPALRNARLTSKLHLSLDEVSTQAAALRASRERLVAAQDAARRRLERDIHDGAQQHLVVLAVTARLARQLVEKNPARAAAMMDDVVNQANEAQASIRELARGVFPQLLADSGVVAALSAQAARARPPIEVHAEAPLTTMRFEPGIEAGVYFCCLEALQNAAKHAPSAHVAVTLSYEDAALRFVVQDDGPGFDSPGAPIGSGLQNMVDRIAAIGGTVEVTSAPSQGTTVAGRVHALPVSPSTPSLELVSSN